MTHADLEDIYAALAEQLDDVGADRSGLYLAKLAMLLAHEIGEVEPVRRAIKQAAASLDV